MFELAAFRKVNPKGPISVLPLFLSSLVAVVWLWVGLASFAIVLILNFMPELVLPGEASYIWVLSSIYFLPLLLLFHFCRKKYQEKHRLLLDLRHFKLEELSCETEFDRNFIHEAVDKWYGGREAFTGLVRGPLCMELLAMMPTPHMPLGYAVSVSTFLASLLVELAVDLHLADVDSLTFVIGVFS